MKTRSLHFEALAASLVLLCCAGRADWLAPFSTNRSDCVAEAKRTGKLVLLNSGNTNTCTACYTLEFHVLPSTNPPVRQFLEEGLVYWACGDDQDYCQDYRVYIPDYPDAFPLPLVCIIDPFHPDSYVARSFGGGETATMLTWFRLGVLQNTTPRVMNLATNQTINTTNFVIRGTSHMTNLPIWRVYYQLNGGAWVFSTVTNFVDWVAPLGGLPNAVLPGTNVFRVYAKDISYNKSHTNAVTFIYDPNAPVGPAPRITGITWQGRGLSLQWQSEPGLSYEIQSSSSLENPHWTPVTTVPSGGRTTTATLGTNGLPANRQFFRLRLGP